MHAQGWGVNPLLVQLIGPAVQGYSCLQDRLYFVCMGPLGLNFLCIASMIQVGKHGSVLDIP